MYDRRIVGAFCLLILWILPQSFPLKLRFSFKFCVNIHQWHKKRNQTVSEKVTERLSRHNYIFSKDKKLGSTGENKNALVKIKSGEQRQATKSSR